MQFGKEYESDHLERHIAQRVWSGLRILIGDITELNLVAANIRGSIKQTKKIKGVTPTIVKLKTQRQIIQSHLATDAIGLKLAGRTGSVGSAQKSLDRGSGRCCRRQIRNCL